MDGQTGARIDTHRGGNVAQGQRIPKVAGARGGTRGPAGADRGGGDGSPAVEVGILDTEFKGFEGGAGGVGGVDGTEGTKLRAHHEDEGGGAGVGACGVGHCVREGFVDAGDGEVVLVGVGVAYLRQANGFTAAGDGARVGGAVQGDGRDDGGRGRGGGREGGGVGGGVRDGAQGVDLVKLAAGTGKGWLGEACCQQSHTKEQFLRGEMGQKMISENSEAFGVAMEHATTYLGLHLVGC